MSSKIIALVGMMGSGKGTCVDYMHTTHNWTVLHFGNMVYEEVQRRGLNNVEDEKFVREDMRNKSGAAVLAKHVARKIDQLLEQGQKVILLDGLYSWSEYKFLNEKYGDSLVLIGTVGDKKQRRERILARKDSHRSYTLEQIVERELAEIENLEKGGPIAYADYYILNDKGVDQLHDRLDEIITELLV
ncbi:MAG: AAA family ATPase [Patescibacteria group bacterium]|jgi:dephospho-CoA kinase